MAAAGGNYMGLFGIYMYVGCTNGGLGHVCIMHVCMYICMYGLFLFISAGYPYLWSFFVGCRLVIMQY